MNSMEELDRQRTQCNAMDSSRLSSAQSKLIVFVSLRIQEVTDIWSSITLCYIEATAFVLVHIWLMRNFSTLPVFSEDEEVAAGLELLQLLDRTHSS